MAKPYDGPAPILVGYDASDDAVSALDWAAKEAAATKTMLVLVYVADDTVVNSAWGVVFEPESIEQTAKRLLADAVEAARAHGVAKKRIRTQVALGTPVGVLAQMSRSASLLVVGRRSSSGSDKVFTGSTAVGLAAAAHCPLIVVSHDLPPVEHHPAVGVAFDAEGRGATGLRWVLANKARYPGPVKVLSVCRAPQGRLFRGAVSPEQIERVMVETRSRIDRLIGATLREFPGAVVTTEVTYGSPVDELVGHSQGLRLLVLEAHPTFPTYSVGGVIRGVVTHAHCPVALVR